MPLEDDKAGSDYPADLIHGIISGFARFTEGSEPKVVFTPQGARLYDRHVVLLYLTTLQALQS